MCARSRAFSASKLKARVCESSSQPSDFRGSATFKFAQTAATDREARFPSGIVRKVRVDFADSPRLSTVFFSHCPRFPLRFLRGVVDFRDDIFPRVIGRRFTARREPTSGSPGFAGRSFFPSLSNREHRGARNGIKLSASYRVSAVRFVYRDAKSSERASGRLTRFSPLPPEGETISRTLRSTSSVRQK